MIQLSGNSEYTYYAVPVPREARKIGFYEYPSSKGLSWYLTYNYGSINIGEKQPELLGVIGPGEEISEEVAKELSKTRITVLFPAGEKPTWNKWLKWFLSKKGTTS